MRKRGRELEMCVSPLVLVVLVLCSASHGAQGQVSSVTVTADPDRTLYSDEEVILTCDITLDPAVDSEVAVTTTWSLPSGLMLSTGVAERSDTFPFPYQSILILSPLMTSDTGIYTCTASVEPDPPNMMVQSSTISATHSIKVEEYSVSITAPSDPTAGQSHTVTCEVVVGEGTPTLQWTGPGVGTLGVTVGNQTETGTTFTLTLTFSPLHTSHGGEYICQSTVYAGNYPVTKTVETVVIVKVFITSVEIFSVPSHTVYSDETVTLTCDITLDPAVDTEVAVTASWTGPGGAITTGVMDKTDAVHLSHQSTLTLSSLKTSDTGDYTCTASFGPDPLSMFVQASDDVSAISTLTIRPYMVSFIAPRDPCAGQSYTLTCEVVVGEGTPTLQWTGPGVETGHGVTLGSQLETGITFTLPLTFSPLLTSHGGEYTCHSILNGAIKNVTATITVSIPAPDVALSWDPDTETTLHHGDSLTLTCDILLDPAVDSEVAVTASWTGPGGAAITTGVSEVTRTEPYQSTLTLFSLMTSDTGDYTCTAIVDPDDPTYYITGSEDGSDELDITVELLVTVLVDYTPPVDFVRPSESDYRAGSGPVTLTCEVKGATGTVSYQWTSTCTHRHCFVTGRRTESISRSFVRAGIDNGTHTCTATDDYATGSGSTLMSIIGIGVNSWTGDDTVPTGTLTNNSIVIATVSGDFYFQCRSGYPVYTDPSLAEFIGLDGSVLINGYTGGLNVHNNPFAHIMHPSVIRVLDTGIPLTAEEEGVYTCRMRDENNDVVEVNVGIYRNGFNTPPSIISLTLDPDLFTLTCTSTGSPATTVTWMKDGSPLDIDGTTYSMEQTVTERGNSTYDNKLSVSGSSRHVLGSYSCEVQNALGRFVTAPIAVPGISVQQLTSSGNTTAGSTDYYLSCTIRVLALRGTPSITWTDPEGRMIFTDIDFTVGAVTESGSTYSSVLMFNSLKTSLAGEYTCSSALDSVAAQSVVAVTVTILPQSVAIHLTTDPDRTLFNGESVTLTCDITLDPAVDTKVAVTASWTGPSGAITTDVMHLTDAVPYQSTLTLSSLEEADNGNYNCHASFDSDPPFSFSLSTHRTLTIETYSLSITAPPDPTAGQSYTLTCKVVVGEGTPTLQWTGSGVGAGGVTVGSQMETGTTFTLTFTFSPLLTSLGGEYTCQSTVTSDAVERTAMTTVRVHIPALSVTVSADPDRTFYNGETVTLTCEITLDPAVDTQVAVTASWTGPAGAITTGVMHMTDAEPYQSILTLPYLMTYDTGDYTCTASVDPDPLSTFVVDIDDYADTYSFAVENYTVSISTMGVAATSETYTLTCTVEGVSARPTIKWFDPDGSEITTRVSTTTLTSTLTLSGLSLSDAGQYTCQSTLSGVVRDAVKELLVENEASFRIQVTPVTLCTTWTDERTQEIETAITTAISKVLSTRLNFNFSVSALKNGVFSCWTSPSEVTYSNTIVSTDNTSQLVGYIEDWVMSKQPFVQVGKFMLRVLKSCPVRIASMEDNPDCPNVVADVPSIIASSDPEVIGCLNQCLDRSRGRGMCASP